MMYVKVCPFPTGYKSFIARIEIDASTLAKIDITCNSNKWKHVKHAFIEDTEKPQM